MKMTVMLNETLVTSHQLCVSRGQRVQGSYEVSRNLVALSDEFAFSVLRFLTRDKISLKKEYVDCSS